MFSTIEGPNNIYTKIEKLDEAKTVKELLTLLKPILNELAYYSVTGDGAVMDIRENWHNTFTDYMYEAAGSNIQPKQGQQVQQNQPHQPHQSHQSQQPHQPQSDLRQRSQPQKTSGHTTQPPQPPAQPKQQLNRPDPKYLPYSLSAIMNGTHSSFNET